MTPRLKKMLEAYEWSMLPIAKRRARNEFRAWRRREAEREAAEKDRALDIIGRTRLD